MADRKPYLKTPKVKPELAELLNKIKGIEITDKQLFEQRISFAYGNAMGIGSITKESIRTASKKMRITD